MRTCDVWDVLFTEEDEWHFWYWSRHLNTSDGKETKRRKSGHHTLTFCRLRKTCERIVFGQNAVRLLVRRSTYGTFSYGRWRWRIEEWKGRWKRRRKVQDEQSKRIKTTNNHARETWMTWCGHTSWVNVTCDIEMCAAKHKKCDVWRISVLTPCWTQQIVNSSKRSCYNNFF